MLVSISTLFFAEAELATQLVLTFAWSIAWYVMIPVLAERRIKPYLSSRPWKDRWVELTGKYLKNALFVEFRTTEQLFDFACQFSAIMCQHGMGGALCVPSLLGCRGPMACALARHGALCEAGWELEDIVQRMWQVKFGGDEGRAKNPPMLLAILCVHHALGLSMVIPMNIAYGSHPGYHEIVFVLQGAAFFALFLQNYGFTLDVRTSSGLRQMRICTGSVLAVLLWSRMLRYWTVAYQVLCTFYNDGRMRMLVVAGPGLCLMGVLNVLFVGDAVKKFIKFWRMRPVHETDRHANESLQRSLRKWNWPAVHTGAVKVRGGA